MKPSNAWIADWQIGESPSREEEISRELIHIFAAFWDASGLSGKSKTTQRRYSNALHALGGHLLEKAVMGSTKHPSTRELLADAVDAEGGPLIFFHIDKPWQWELDTVCKKLHRYLERTR